MMINLISWFLLMKKKLILGYGEKMDMFFALEEVPRKSLLIVRVFLNEIKCKKFIKEKNKRMKESLFFEI